MIIDGCETQNTKLFHISRKVYGLASLFKALSSHAIVDEKACCGIGELLREIANEIENLHNDQANKFRRKDKQ